MGFTHEKVSLIFKERRTLGGTQTGSSEAHGTFTLPLLIVSQGRIPEKFHVSCTRINQTIQVETGNIAQDRWSGFR